MLYCLSSKFIKKDTKKTMSLWTHLVQHLPAGVYLLKVSNENTKAMCEICSKSMIKTPNDVITNVVPTSLSLTFNRFHTFSGVFVGGFKQVNTA